MQACAQCRAVHAAHVLERLGGLCLSCLSIFVMEEEDEPKVGRSECAQCRSSHPAHLLNRLGGLCASCLAAFIMEDDGPTAGRSNVKPRPRRYTWWLLGGSLMVFLVIFAVIPNLPVEQPPADENFIRVTWGDGQDEMTVRPGRTEAPVERTPNSPELQENFTLRFRIRYEIEPDWEPWILLVFTAASRLPEDAHAVIFFPEGDHSLAFASRITGRGWGIRERGSLPVGKLVRDTWSDVEVNWDGDAGRLRVSVDGAVSFDHQLPDMVTLDGPWKFAVGGAASEVRISSVQLKNEAPSREEF